jgi:hypothetical protein
VVAIFVFCAIAEYSKRVDKARIMLICLLVFVVFFGFRGFIGWDWAAYYPIFQKLEPLWGKVANNFDIFSEPGYVLYATIIKSIIPDYQSFILISVIIDAIVLHHVFKRYSPNYALSFAVFMAVSLVMEVDTLRNAKSLMVCLLSLQYILQRKPIKFAVLILIAISFHTSAILFIPLYFFAHKKTSIYVFVTLFITGNIVFLFQIPLIKPLLARIGQAFASNPIGLMINTYLDIPLLSAARGISMGYLERTLTALLVMCFYDKLNSANKLFVNLFIVYIAVSLFMSEMLVVFTRVGALFVISYWIIWPMLAECFSIRNNRRLYLSAMTTCLSMYVTVRSISVLYKYDNFLTGARSYNERIVIFNRWAEILLEK